MSMLVRFNRLVSRRRILPLPVSSINHTHHHLSSSNCRRAHSSLSNPTIPFSTRFNFPPAVMASETAIQELTEQLKRLPIDSVEQFPNSAPHTNPLDLFRSHIAVLLGEVAGVDPKIVYPAVTWTSTLDKGDFNVAVAALRIKGRKPDELAAELVAKFPESPMIEKPTTSGTFLQFFCRKDVLTKYLIPNIRSRGSKYGHNPTHGLRDPADPSKGKKHIIVEFSSPNVAKNFHAGHLRSTIIGGFLANLYDAAGWDVTRINYLGDWGKQYGLLALAYTKYGNEEKLEQDPIMHLHELYVRINAEVAAEKEKIAKLKEAGEDTTELEQTELDEQARKYFKRMVDGDEEALDLWRRFRALSVARFEKTYARLNIHFDSYSGESGVPESAMQESAKILADKGISEESNGATIVDFSKHVPGKVGKGLEKAVVRRKDGTALYLTRDISELIRRKKVYNFDKILYVVGGEQSLHLRQFFKIVELMGDEETAKSAEHIVFGHIHNMSTRKGTAKFLDDILADVGDKMHEVMRKSEDKYAQVVDPEKTADILGISSVMVQDMTGKRINNYKFDMDKMTSFEGDTGPYLQYAHTRICSIRRKANLSPEEVDTADLSLLTEDHATNLVRMLAQWPDVVTNTLRTHEPCTVLTYLFKMSHMLSSSYDHLRIVGSERELMKARFALYDAAGIVINNGMKMLGLSPLERM